MFLLKKIISPFLFPLPLSFGIIAAGLILLWFTKRQRLGRILATAGAALLLLVSLAPVSEALLAPFEHQYRPFGEADSARAAEARIRYVVVLGGGHRSDPALPPTAQLDPFTAARLIEGIRIHRMLPETRLLLSGGAVFDPVPNARVMAEVARALGVTEGEMLLETQSRDTEEEVRAIKDRIGIGPFILVTSADHMPRAMAMFEKLEMHPWPAPAGQFVKQRRSFDPSIFFPRGRYLVFAEHAAYELYGTIWAWIRGNL